MRFNFPPNISAEGCTIGEQCRKIHEEAGEVLEGLGMLEGGSKSDAFEIAFLMEVIDVMQACEGVLRKFSPGLTHRAFLEVLKKCERRGDYDA